MEKKNAVIELKTPCGTLTIKKNGVCMPFRVCDNEYNAMYIPDENTGRETPVYPDGCVKIAIDVKDMDIGDIINCVLNTAVIKDDGGGEDMLNATGQCNGFYIGIGAPDTRHDMPFGCNNSEQYCYESCHCEGGYEFRILNNPMLYKHRYIFLSVVWCNSEKPYAEEIVSFLTS